MTTKKQFIQEQLDRISERSSNRQIEAAKLFMAAKAGDMTAKAKLAEGISTSDIPTLLEPTINITFLAQYAQQETVWDQIADVYEAPDFGRLEFGDFEIDASALISNDGDEFVAGGLPVVGEYDEYPAVKFVTEQLNKDFDRKRGVKLRISWEALRRSGNVDIITRATEAFARMAAMQEDISLAKEFVTVGAAGVNAENWTGRGIAGNPDLTADGIGAPPSSGDDSPVAVVPARYESYCRSKRAINRCNSSFAATCSATLPRYSSRSRFRSSNKNASSLARPIHSIAAIVASAFSVPAR